MSDEKGTVAQTSLPLSRRQHRSQLRILEANPPGIGPFDGWHDFVTNGGFANTWMDGQLAGTSAAARAGYGRTSDGNWVALRGRLRPDPAGAFPDGTVAYVLPVGYRPAYRASFVARVQYPFFEGGASQGHVIIEPSGAVIPYLTTTGYGSGWDINFDPFTFGGVDTPLNPLDWTKDTGGPLYAYEGGGTVGIFTGVSQGTEFGSIYYGTGDYADCEISVTAVAATTRIKLGLRCQPYNFNFGFPEGAGTWMRIASAAGANLMETYYMDPITGQGGHTFFGSPGYSPGDTITYRAMGTYVEILKNGVTLGASSSPMPMGAGVFGLGMNGASGIPLLRDFVGGLAKPLEISLDGIYFNLNP